MTFPLTEASPDRTQFDGYPYFCVRVINGRRCDKGIDLYFKCPRFDCLLEGLHEAKARMRRRRGGGVKRERF